MPICHNCGKESKNLRVCPFCFVEYRPQAATSRKSGGVLGGGDVFAAWRNAPPLVRRGLIAGLVAILGVSYFTMGRESEIPVGVVVADVVPGPMSRNEAEALVQQTKETSKVEVRGTNITVTFAKARWPERRVGQLALAQRYARAVEVVEGARRNISFLDPDGAVYATGSAAGVVLVK